MENLKNIKIIKKSYDLDRQKFVYEIHKVNNLIARREATIQKITSYKKEYTNDDNLQLSKSIPVLSKNIDLFTAKIDAIIDAEKVEIEKLHRIKSSIMTKIVSLDDKIKLMGHFEDKANATKALKMEKADQTSLDDLSSTMHLRGSHV
jgi:flagellar biosynthesis chaperone FliJ